ncbi:hypothetical protein ACIG47_19435 [Promicromonospora sp. NPDC052451]|uniref:hypothetical protein n=1 Tax=Promicromonospora sp. NPDC052451 TaxID=3364407 RepID=UPI0037C9B83C
MPAMNFDQALRAERWHALTLGIPGMSPGANASRLRTARRVWAEYVTYSQKVYDSQRWTYDPDPRPSFCLYPLIEAGGNGPEFTGTALDDMGREHREEIVSDEDDTGWEGFGPDIDDYRAAARETAHIRAQLQIRGLVPPRPRSQAVTFRFLPPRDEPPTSTGIEPPF